MKTFSMTDIGLVRKVNQDYVFTSEKPVGFFPNLFLVADGMGGHNAGDLASKTAVETIVSYIEDYNFVPEKEEDITIQLLMKVLKEALLYTNEEVRNLASENVDYYGMGTTLVGAVILGDSMLALNVGDSRLYLIKDEIHQITIDHSLVEEMIRIGKITKEGARQHPDKNIITRAIGAKDDLEIDFFERKIGKNELILLCSDGLTNMLEDYEIKNIVRNQRDIAEMVEQLITLANMSGGKDNIAVVIIEP